MNPFLKLTDVRERNMQVLREWHPALFEVFSALENGEPGMTVRAEPSKADVPTLYLSRGEISGYYHSRYQPVVEAERWAEAHKGKDVNNLAFLGFGLGYQIQALREAAGKGTGIIVLEPAWEVFDAALRFVDLTGLLQDPDLHLIIGGTARQLAREMGALAGKKMFEVEWLEWPAFRRFYGNDYMDEFNKQLSHSMRDARLDQNTVLYFQRDWPRNILYNLPKILTNPGVNALQNKFSQKPAIIVSAGPSLSKNVDMLQELKGKAVILCVDTAYRVLQAKGIRPDLIFSLDGSELNYRHFTGVTPEGVPMVMVPNVHHKIIEEYGQRVFSANIYDMLVHDAIQNIEPKGLLSVSGSVATLAFSTACRMNCDPVIFIGQDLAYPGGQAYSKGTMFEKMTKSMQNGFMMRHVEGIDGKPVLTDAPLDSFRKWFETQIEEYEAGRTFVDATEGGAKIQGTAIMTLREAADRYCSEPFDVQGIIEKALERPTEGLTQAAEALHTMARTLHQIRRLSKIALQKNQELRELYKVRRLRTSKVAAVSVMLDRIEENIKRLNQKKWLDAPLQHLLIIVTKGKLATAPEQETDHAKAMRVTENAQLLYHGMVQTAEELKEHVEVALSRLESETEQGEIKR